MGHLSFSICLIHQSLQTLIVLWSYFDVHPSLLEVSVWVCPQWTGNGLHVRASLVNDDDAIDAITVCIKQCMRWCDFSDTRWTQVGECARLFMKLLLVGIGRIASIATTNSAVFRCHLNGFFETASSSVRLYFWVWHLWLSAQLNQCCWI